MYAAVVPSVRNLDAFLSAAGRAAQARGARGTPAARLAPTARADLETKLRGLNASTFLQCRATQNSAVGFPVDLTCDARRNDTLYRAGDTIRRVTVNPRADSRTLQQQISDLAQDAVLELTTRGVPGEYIAGQGLDVNEFVSVLTRLSALNTNTATVSIAARQDVKPGTAVTLYARVQ